MAHETPSCCDSPLDTLRKILLTFIELATNPPSTVNPNPSDSRTDLYRKILLTLPFI